MAGRHNRLVKEARACGSRHGRDKCGSFLVEGVRSVQELASHAPHAVVTVFVDAAQSDTEALSDILASLSSKRIPITMLAPDTYASLAETDTPQGVLALATQMHVSLQDMLVKQSEFIVISDQIQDPGNLGTILRISDAVGADGFIATAGSADLYNPKTVRAAMGSLFHLMHTKDISAEEVCLTLKQKGYSLMAADASGSVEHYDVPFIKPLAIIFGNEAGGISEVVRSSAQLVRIPMPGQAESLNVGIAAGVLLYEVLRQWRQV